MMYRNRSLFYKTFSIYISVIVPIDLSRAHWKSEYLPYSSNTYGSEMINHLYRRSYQSKMFKIDFNVDGSLSNYPEKCNPW